MFNYKKLAPLVVLFFAIFSSNSVSAAGWFNCNILAVFEIPESDDIESNEIQVNCSNKYKNTYEWLALDKRDWRNPEENRFTAMAMAAILSGRTFRVYMTDESCSFNACRKVNAWSLYDR